MATVRTTQTGYGGPRMFTQRVRVNADGQFRCNLPADMATMLFGKPKMELVEKTLKDLDRKWNELVKRFKTANTITRKVILYATEMQARIVDPPAGDDTPGEHGVDYEYRVVLQEDDLSFAHGIGLAVVAGVYQEDMTLHGEHQIFNYTELPSTIPVRMRSSRIDMLDGL